MTSLTGGLVPPLIEERLSFGRIGVVAALAAGVGGAIKWKISRRGAMKVVPYKDLSAGAGKRPTESLIEGSEVKDGGRIPDCVVRIARKEGSEYQVIGAGWRVRDYLITPMHNLPVAKNQDYYILADDSGLPSKIHKLDMDQLHMLAADLAAIPVPAGVWSRMGVRVSKLGVLSRTATVTITSVVDSTYTIGKLVPGDMGEVKYHGSTKNGYSGSIYMNGTQVLGMHTHGGKYGGGYEALYIWSLLKAYAFIKDEDSDEYLVAKDEEELQRMYVADKVVARSADGHYFVYTQEQWDRAQERKQQEIERNEEIAREARERAYAFMDLDRDRRKMPWEARALPPPLEFATEPRIVPEAHFSGESQQPLASRSQPGVARSPASGLSDSDRRPVPTPLQELTTICGRLSERHVRGLVTQASSMPPNGSTSLQTRHQKQKA